VAAIEVAKGVDAIAKAKGVTQLEDGFESRALGLREEAMRKGPFEEQVAAALPILEAGTATLDEFLQQWDILVTPVLRAPVYKIGMRDQTKFPFKASVLNSMPEVPSRIPMNSTSDRSQYGRPSVWT
jgi:hypothetical protein